MGVGKFSSVRNYVLETKRRELSKPVNILFKRMRLENLLFSSVFVEMIDLIKIGFLDLLWTFVETSIDYEVTSKVMLLTYMHSSHDSILQLQMESAILLATERVRRWSESWTEISGTCSLLWRFQLGIRFRNHLWIQVMHYWWKIPHLAGKNLQSDILFFC